MSIVPTTGLIRRHYEEAVDDIEYKSVAFWTVILHKHFNDPEMYSVTPEPSPDGSLRRADMVVKRYDGQEHTLSALLWVECKRPSGSVVDVEEQALDAAKRCIRQDKLLWIYAMTTIGVSFRLWFIPKDSDPQLMPVHGNANPGDPRQYLDAGSAAAAVFASAIEKIKLNYPLHEPIMVPSQPATT